MPPLRNAASLEAVGTFRKLFEIAPEIMLIVDADGCIVLANPQIEQLLGYRAEELTGQSVDLLLPERLRAAHVRHRKAFAADPHPRAMGGNRSFVARRKDGRDFPVEIALAPMMIDSAAFVVASMRDVTELRRAREATIKRARYNRQLARLSELALGTRQLEEWFAAVPAILAEALEVDVVIVYLLDYGGTRLLCKAAHGLTAAQIEALNEPVHRSSQPGYVMASGEVLVIDDYAVETRVRVNPVMRDMGMQSAIGIPLSDGRHSIGTLTARAAQPHRFKDDEVDFMKAAGNIVTATIERLRAEEQLGHAQRLESLGQLTGGIAHDFNNLLTVISGNLQLIEDAARDYPALAKPVAAALRATARGAGLTTKLLAFARQQTLNPRAVDLAQYLPHLQDMLARTLGESIEIRALVPPVLPPCLADPGQLDNALINLALNARDAMPRGGRLTLEAGEVAQAGNARGNADAKPGRYIVISVSDTGVGMAPEVKARAFEPFFTTKEAGKGSGLGLSMVYGFVSQSGGHLTVYSEPGNGTTVRLYLPSAVSLEAEAAVVPDDRGGHSECILVVEDDAEVRALAVNFLSALGYSVLEAGNAKAALNALELEPGVDLLFTDVVLTGSMTGPDLAHKAQTLRPGLRVLLATGYARGGLPPERVAGREYALLHKPYRREELAAAVRVQLDRPRPPT